MVVRHCFLVISGLLWLLSVHPIHADILQRELGRLRQLPAQTQQTLNTLASLNRRAAIDLDPSFNTLLSDMADLADKFVDAAFGLVAIGCPVRAFTKEADEMISALGADFMRQHILNPLDATRYIGHWERFLYAAYQLARIKVSLAAIEQILRDGKQLVDVIEELRYIFVGMRRTRVSLDTVREQLDFTLTVMAQLRAPLEDDPQEAADLAARLFQTLLELMEALREQLRESEKFWDEMWNFGSDSFSFGKHPIHAYAHPVWAYIELAQEILNLACRNVELPLQRLDAIITSYDGLVGSADIARLGLVIRALQIAENYTRQQQKLRFGAPPTPVDLTAARIQRLDRVALRIQAVLAKHRNVLERLPSDILKVPIIQDPELKPTQADLEELATILKHTSIHRFIPQLLPLHDELVQLIGDFHELSLAARTRVRPLSRAEEYDIESVYELLARIECVGSLLLRALLLSESQYRMEQFVALGLKIVPLSILASQLESDFRNVIELLAARAWAIPGIQSFERAGVLGD